MEAVNFRGLEGGERVFAFSSRGSRPTICQTVPYSRALEDDGSKFNQLPNNSMTDPGSLERVERTGMKNSSTVAKN